MKQTRFQIVTPTGALVVRLTGDSITGIDLQTRPLKNLPPARSDNEKRIAAELKAYFDGSGAGFSVITSSGSGRHCERFPPAA